MPTPDTETDDGWRPNPGWPRLRTYLLLGLGLDLLFLLVYGGANELAAHRGGLWRVHFDWELAIPLVPWMIHVYLSVFVLVLLPPFALGPAALRRLAGRIALAILVAGAVFLLFPARLGFPQPEQVAEHATLFQLVHLLDRPHNLLPSLHVAIAALIIDALWVAGKTVTRLALGSWLALICVAVVLVHQHHVLDVAAGLVLAWLLGGWNRTIGKING